MEKLLEMMMELRSRLSDEQEAGYMEKDYYRLEKLRVECSRLVDELFMAHNQVDIEPARKTPIPGLPFIDVRNSVGGDRECTSMK